MSDKRDGIGSDEQSAPRAVADDQPADPARRSAVRRSASYLLAGIGIAAIGSIASQPALAGYGCCWKCGCQGFEATPGDQDRCSNCGHMFSDHGRICPNDHRTATTDPHQSQSVPSADPQEPRR